MMALLRLLLLAPPLVAATANISVSTVLPGNPHHASSSECESWWSPLLLSVPHSNGSSTTVLIAMCKRGQGSRAAPFVKLVQSPDSGRTWGPQIDITNQTLGQFAYSKASSKIVMLVGMPQPKNECGSPCHCAMIKHCNHTEGKGATCEACEKDNAKAMQNAACNPSKLSRFCYQPPLQQQQQQQQHHHHQHHQQHHHQHQREQLAEGAAAAARTKTSEGGDELAWAHELPPPSATRLQQLQGAVVTSSDGGLTWTEPTRPVDVNGSVGPHYVGGGINHGIELQRGKHAGRLVFARRFDGALRLRGDPSDLTPYMRSFILFSDDNGATFTVGQLLPASWTECEVAELKNGSLLMTARIEGCVAAYGKNTTSCGHERGFARSDDGERVLAAHNMLGQTMTPELCLPLEALLVYQKAGTETTQNIHKACTACTV